MVLNFKVKGIICREINNLFYAHMPSPKNANSKSIGGEPHNFETAG